MRNIHDHNEYHKYKSTTEENNKNSSNSSSTPKPTGLGWIVIGIVVFMLISFISDNASGDAISTLLGFGFIAYLIAQAISK